MNFALASSLHKFMIWMTFFSRRVMTGSATQVHRWFVLCHHLLKLLLCDQARILVWMIPMIVIGKNGSDFVFFSHPSVIFWGNKMERMVVKTPQKYDHIHVFLEKLSIFFWIVLILMILSIRSVFANNPKRDRMPRESPCELKQPIRIILITLSIFKIRKWSKPSRNSPPQLVFFLITLWYFNFMTWSWMELVASDGVGGWLVGWSVGWSVGWAVGWSVGWSCC